MRREEADLTIRWHTVWATLALLGVIMAGAWVFAWRGHDDANLQKQTKTSQQGLFMVTLEPEGGRIKLGEMHPWLLTLKTAAGKPVEYAAIDISGGMPQHRHGLPSSPQASDYLGQGRYRIEGLKFTMDGWWQLRVAVSAAAGTDTAIFNVVL